MISLRLSFILPFTANILLTLLNRWWYEWRTDKTKLFFTRAFLKQNFVHETTTGFMALRAKLKGLVQQAQSDGNNGNEVRYRNTEFKFPINKSGNLFIFNILGRLKYGRHRITNGYVELYYCKFCY